MWNSRQLQGYSSQALKRFRFTDSPRTNAPSRRSYRFPRPLRYGATQQLEPDTDASEPLDASGIQYNKLPALSYTIPGGRPNNAHSSEQTMMPLCRHMVQRKHRLSCIQNAAYHPQRRLTPLNDPPHHPYRWRGSVPRRPAGPPAIPRGPSFQHSSPSQ